MTKLPAYAGWLWIKEGFALFRKQPMEMATLFMSYMFLMFAVGLIPLAGQVLPMILVPAFSMAFMQACVQAEQGRRIYPSLLLTGFRSPAFRSLLVLGVLYLLAALLALAAAALVDDGILWKVLRGDLQLDSKEVRESSITLGLLVAAAVYTPFAMAFWYAAPLAAWKNMSSGKPVFFSFFAVRNSTSAFLFYGLAWAILASILPTMLGVVFIIIGSTTLALIASLACAIVLSVVMYCSFYPSYTHIFGKPGEDIARIE